MKTLQLLLGGVVAVVSALGLTMSLGMAIGLIVARRSHRETQKAKGVGAIAGGVSETLVSPWFWLIVLVSFSVGLFLAYRKLYMKQRRSGGDPLRLQGVGWRNEWKSDFTTNHREITAAIRVTPTTPKKITVNRKASRCIFGGTTLRLLSPD